MDDRFRPEDTDVNKKPTAPRPPQISKTNSLGDFSENIDSVRGKSMAEVPSVTSSSKMKKFQVTLPDEANLIPDFSSAQQTTDRPHLQNVTGRQYLESIQNKPVNKPVNTINTTGAQAGNKVQSSQRTRIVPDVNSTAIKKQNVATNERANNNQKPAAKGNKVVRKPDKSVAGKKYNFINSVLVACVCVIFIAILTVTASTVAMTTINDILVINKGESDGYVSVYIAPESDYEDVFNALKDAGLVKQPLITDFFCKFRHYDEIDIYKDGAYVETRKIAYEAGNYYLDADMGIEAMLESMMSSRMNSSDTVRLTFPEGWTIAQIFEKIEKYNVCEADKLYANLDIIGSQYGFIEDIESTNGRYLKAEGYLFPDTYDFFIGENASSVIKKLFNNFEVKWKDEYKDRIKELGMTVDEVITIASIIQREAKDTTQMDDISSVIHNRLADRATYPSIDMNSTKDYVLSLKDFKLFSDFYYNLYLNSYNTYSNGGLPPGPICNPGAAAIRAALYPAENDYHFFCHDDSGTIYLAVTASEHQANTEKVLYGH